MASELKRTKRLANRLKMIFYIYLEIESRI